MGKCGCPACLTTNEHVKNLVKEWGERNDLPNLKPEDLTNLADVNQRKLMDFVVGGLILSRD